MLLTVKPLESLGTVILGENSGTAGQLDVNIFTELCWSPVDINLQMVDWGRMILSIMRE